jgi:hypothetical protein
MSSSPKATLLPIIARQWREAIQLLAGARRLWIIGYSFPADTCLFAAIVGRGHAGK